jgi:hypothetical protein
MFIAGLKIDLKPPSAISCARAAVWVEKSGEFYAVELSGQEEEKDLQAGLRKAKNRMKRRKHSFNSSWTPETIFMAALAVAENGAVAIDFGEAPNWRLERAKYGGSELVKLKSGSGKEGPSAKSSPKGRAKKAEPIKRAEG